MLVKFNLSESIAVQIQQGATAVTMSSAVMGINPLITTLSDSNTVLQSKQAAVAVAKQMLADAYGEAAAAAKLQRGAYYNLGAQVNIDSDGDPNYVRSTGYSVRKNATPIPPLVHAPANVMTSVNGVAGRIVTSWKKVFGARNYEVQYTTDLTGATGWTSVEQTPGNTKLNVDGLTSGTKYALRVRALGNGQPGPWSGPVQQIAL